MAHGQRVLHQCLQMNQCSWIPTHVADQGSGTQDTCVMRRSSETSPLRVEVKDFQIEHRFLNNPGGIWWKNRAYNLEFGRRARRPRAHTLKYAPNVSRLRKPKYACSRTQKEFPVLYAVFQA